MQLSIAFAFATAATALTTNGGPCTADDMASMAAASIVWPNCSTTETSLLSMIPKDATQLTTWCASSCSGPCNMAQQLSMATVASGAAPAKCMAAAGLPTTTTIKEWISNFKPAYCNLADCLDGLKTVNASLPNCLFNGEAILPTPCPANVTKAPSSATNHHVASVPLVLACLGAFFA
ncbi:Aste57867_25312 [Aphanomyces stellatus]|uniref:Aste57867_25312 protein n=1 Tax=Aphanomyces stellatus TaxID=120398 RepID=A0A485LV85_9STRA|nr:hypothetical protein As57867_025234 [Aphanomyces stellatus]VFU01937.1 Aste57867_25312 [Aphanomyces stellatus]